MTHRKRASNMDSMKNHDRKADAEEDITELMERIHRLEKEKKELEDRNKGLEDRNKGLEDRNKGLEDRNRNLEEKIEDLEIENKIFRKALETKGIMISDLQDQISDLKRRVNMNSTNSSKPPSTDMFRTSKKRSLRRRSGSRPGGQPGHKGHNMRLPHEPDIIVSHHPSECEGCPNRDRCSDSMFSVKESRYVVDIEMRTNVTEHRILCAKGCPKHEKYIVGSFPEGVSANIQYGDSVAVTACLLNTYGAVSDSRISTVMRNLFGIQISPGTVVSMVSRSAKKVRTVLDTIKQRIIESDVAHFDETGSRVNGRTLWVHNSSTDEYTYLTISGKRGRIGMEENGVLPEFNGTAVHDCLTSYWSYDVRHVICNAHILRELNGIIDNLPERVWPKLMRVLLLDMKSAKDDAIRDGSETVPQYLIECFDYRFRRIMTVAKRERPPPPEPMIKRKGRRRLGKERALIERIQKNWGSMNLFVHEMNIPFDNNQAERDVRNVKTKIKVSGCFRSIQGAEDYLDIMSYLSTAAKHGIDAVRALKAAFRGESHIVLSRTL